MGSPGSRARRFRACHGSTTARGSLTACDGAASDVAFRHSHDVGTPVALISRLNSPAYTCPCERFAAPSRVANASLGVTVGRRPFGVELSISSPLPVYPGAFGNFGVVRRARQGKAHRLPQHPPRQHHAPSAPHGEGRSS